MDGTLSENSSRVVEGSARKRKRNSQENGTAIDLPEPVKMGSGTNALVKATHVDCTPCQHEHRLKLFNIEFEAMRQLITCKICQRFLYQPFGLACGHTFCYSCLNQWIGPNKKKTCPDCRSVIKQQPNSSYLIRELVLLFISRPELLPEGDTVEEHQQSAKEEAEIVNKDRANADDEHGGLFNGCFGKRGRLANYAFRDEADHVDRCPQCFCEVEAGYCTNCDLRVRSENDSWDTSDSEPGDELDHELMEDLDADLAFGLNSHDTGQDSDFYNSDDDEEGPLSVLEIYSHEQPSRAPPIVTRDRRRPRRATDDSEEESGDHDPSMDDFVVDDNAVIDVDSDSESDATEVDNSASQRQQRRRNLPTRVVLSSDDEESTLGHQREASVGDVSSDGHESESPDSEDEAPIRAGSQRSKHQRLGRAQRPVPLESEDDERSVSVDSEDDEEMDNEYETRSDTTSSAIPYASFSPLGGFAHTDDYGASGNEDEDEDEDGEGDDDDEPDEEDDYDDHGIMNDHYGEVDNDEGDDEGLLDGSSDGFYWWGSICSFCESPNTRCANVSVRAIHRTASQSPRVDPPSSRHVTAAEQPIHGSSPARATTPRYSYFPPPPRTIPTLDESQPLASFPP